jgi:ceramide glucosyltransferase
VTPLEVVTLAHGAFGAGFVAIGTAAFLRRPRANASPAPLPPVVLLRPAEILDDVLRARLSEDANAYEGHLTRIVCLASFVNGETHVAGARLIASDLPGDAPKNRKACHLAAGVAAARRAGLIARDSVIVHADADVALCSRDLAELVRTLGAHAPDGAAFAAPSPQGGTRLGELAVRAIVCASPQAFAYLWSVARITGAPPAIAGKLVAIRAGTLSAIGGYEALTPFIADDIALVDALHAQRRPVALANFAVRTVASTRTFADVRAQMTRWLTVASAHRPGLLILYPLLVAPAIVVSALALSCVTTGHAITAAIAVTLLLIPRVVLSIALDGLYRDAQTSSVRRGARNFAGIFIGDFVLTLAAMRALCGGHIVWSGRRYRLKARRRGQIATIANVQSTRCGAAFEDRRSSVRHLALRVAYKIKRLFRAALRRSTV